jgi:uncharacterized damage-inducible protein DinB
MTETPPHPEIGISFHDLFRYHHDETRRWREWLQQQSADVLDISMGAEADAIATVRAMLFHIFTVEWAYAQTLNGEPFDAWSSFKQDSLNGLFHVSDVAQAGLRKFLDAATPATLDSAATLSGGGMTLTGTRRKFVMHTFLHSARHWAQLAMVLRQHGHKTNWHHDLVLSNVIR